MRKMKFIGVFASLIGMAFPQWASAQNFGDKTTTAVHPEWIENAVIYEANLRQGTEQRNLKGLQQELPRLKDLGVDIVWLMPIHPISELNRKGELGSYYAVKDYKDVNPEFGTVDDLKEFVKAAHDLGMKVILDEVCNHSGCDNAWVTEHPDYYAKDENGNMFGPFDWTDTYKFDYSNPAMREAMLDALTFWVEECDIDGYRFDVAMEVPTDFWVTVRERLSKIKPVFMLAEASKPELTLNAMDADYNWPMKELFNEIAYTAGVTQYADKVGKTYDKKTANDIPKLYYKQRREYPKGAINMNMTTNHDLNSWEGTEFDRYGAGNTAFAVLAYTLPGIPMLYTGQEVGFNHALEFFQHDSVPNYTPNKFTNFYTRLGKLKHEHPALGATQGKFKVLPTRNPHVLAFERSNGDDKVIVIVNLSNQRQKIVDFSKEVPYYKETKNIFNNQRGQIPLMLRPWESIVLAL